MSESGDVLTEVLAVLATSLGGSYSQHPRNYDLQTLPATMLENRYSVVFDTATEDAALIVGKLVITRNIVVSITYRTFQHGNDSKANTLLTTVYNKEEALWLALRNYGFTTASGQILSLVDSEIEMFNNENESFLRNIIRMRIRYLAN